LLSKNQGPQSIHQQVPKTMFSKILALRQFALLLLISTCKANLDMGAVRLPDKSGFRFKLWVPHAHSVKIELKDASAKDGAPRSVDLVRREEHGNPNIWYAESPDAKVGEEYRVCIESSWNDCYASEGAILHRRDPYAR
jgi:1,4-alpha-glucan branching enzyme